MKGISYQMEEKNNIPLVSVIMGIYNTSNKNEVYKSIESIKNQTLKNWECIICDDGSKDDTYKFLKEITHKDSRFKIIQNNQNSGLGYSLNHALSYVKSDYVIRQDADDYSKKNRFDFLYHYMVNHDDVDVLGTGMFLFDENGIWGNYKIRTYQAKKEDFLIGTVVAHPSTIIKTESLRKCNGYRISWETKRCEDYDLFMRMFSKGYKIHNVEDQLYYYKVSKNGIKRKFINVIKECVVRYKGFSLLHLGLKKWIYIVKPFIVYIIPNTLKQRIKERDN